MYLNDELIVDKSNFRFKEALQFKDKNDNDYEFKLFVNSFLSGEIEANLARNGDIIKRIIIKGEKIGGDRRTNFSKTLLYFSVIITFFTLERIFNLPFIVVIGLIILAFVVYMRSLDKGQIEYIFEEIDS